METILSNDMRKQLFISLLYSMIMNATFGFILFKYATLAPHMKQLFFTAPVFWFCAIYYCAYKKRGTKLLLFFLIISSFNILRALNTSEITTNIFLGYIISQVYFFYCTYKFYKLNLASKKTK